MKTIITKEIKIASHSPCKIFSDPGIKYSQIQAKCSQIQVNKIYGNHKILQINKLTLSSFSLLTVDISKK